MPGLLRLGRNLGQRVDLEGQAALVAVGGVLVQHALAAGLVHHAQVVGSRSRLRPSCRGHGRQELLQAVFRWTGWRGCAGGLTSWAAFLLLTCGWP